MTEYEDDTIKKASEELAALTPEDYLDLLATLKKYEAGLPEAPATLNFVGFDDRGWRCQFTLRDVDEYAVLSRFHDMVEILDGMGFVPEHNRTVSAQSQDATAPQGAAQKEAVGVIRITTSGVTEVSGADIDVFDVDSIVHTVNDNGKHALNVKGGPWQQYGWKAWPEVLPKSFDLTSRQIGLVGPPPPDMKVAYVDKAKRKIVAFATRE